MNTFITSFNERGYNLYGREFLTTWRMRGPRDCNLVVFYEGNALDKLAKKWDFCEWRDILEVESLQPFMAAIMNFPVLCGHLPDGRYQINWDARMGRKSFMLAHACKQFGGKVFWIDADMVVHSPVPDGFVDSTLPEGKLSCYLGRDGWYYTESGYLGYDTAHPSCERFVNAVRMYFLTGLIFTAKRFHDCEAYDLTRAATEHPEWFHNLAEGLPFKTMHPFVNSSLGAYFDHRKGPRKRNRSTQADLVIERKEEYWTQHGSGEPTLETSAGTM